MSTVVEQNGGPEILERIRQDMDERFQRNLILLQHLMPEAYERFRDYTPSRLQLRLDPAQGPVVTGMLSGASAYPGDPLDHAREQVEQFLETPRIRISRFGTREILQMDQEAHTRRANQVIELINQRPRDPVQRFEGSVNTLFVFGVGLGYHLELLLEAADVHHLCIVEPDPDFFHAALHTVEFGALVERFSRSGYSLEVIVDRPPREVGDSVRTWLGQIGYHNAVETFWFRHRGGETVAEIERLLDTMVLQQATSFLGYYDDERTSLAHTVANAGAGVDLLTVPVEDESGPGAELPRRPVFVVANGPSLDEAVDYLREHRDEAVVMSCGTALGSLVRAGIIPDIHVEMERTRPVLEWILQATTQEQRDQILMVALNPVHPEVFELFPDSVMGYRAFDLGAAWLERRLPKGVTPLPISSPGPTVGNCGIGVAATLGFRDVTLFGLDLGYPVGAQHHSRLSVHYQVPEEKHESLGVYRYDDPENPVGPGNFGGEVRTTPVYVKASQQVEHLKAQYPDLSVRNTSRGLRIPETDPVSVDALGASESFDTRAYARDLVARHTATAPVRPLTADERTTIQRGLAKLAGEVRRILAHEVGSRDEAMFLLMLTHLQLHKGGEAPERLEPLLLLRGSVAHFSVLLAQALHVRSDEDQALALFNQCRSVLDELLADIQERAVSPRLFALDDKTRNLDRKVARSA